MSDRLEFRPRENGEFDEIVARFGDGMVHVETMSGTSCYVGFYWNDGLVCQWYINSARKLTYHHEVSRSVATPPDTQGAGYGELVERLDELRLFLGGHSALDGCHFGERPADAKGAFWWRPYLDRLIRANEAIQTLTAENERLEAKLARAEQDREQARAEAIEQAQADDGWLPIEQAPRDGTRVLVILRDPLPDDRPDLARWAGVPFVARNRGDSSDWCFAAPVGCGGWPDEWLVGWRPLPRSLSAAQEG
jgi:hypothetical protein